MKILFMGTAPFAVASLRALVEAGHEVAAVLTMPDKPMGRGRKLHSSEVKKYALERGLRVLQPAVLKDPDLLEELRLLNPDLGVVVAFRMLPRELWQLPRLGTVNLHASLLPDYRGAAPIQWAVINGDTETGLTTFQLQHEIDTGDVLLQCRLPILPNDTAGTLHDRLMPAAGELILDTVSQLAAGRLRPQRQESLPGKRRPAPKIFKQDCRIDWTLSATAIASFVRGMNPTPGARSLLTVAGLPAEEYKISAVTALSERLLGLTPGAVHIVENNTILLVAAGSGGCIRIDTLQAPGKKLMPAADFLRGLR